MSRIRILKCTLVALFLCNSVSGCGGPSSSVAPEAAVNSTTFEGLGALPGPSQAESTTTAIHQGLHRQDHGPLARLARHLAR